jgi:hypothetical protein
MRVLNIKRENTIKNFNIFVKNKIISLSLSLQHFLVSGLTTSIRNETKWKKRLFFQERAIYFSKEKGCRTKHQSRGKETVIVMTFKKIWDGEGYFLCAWLPFSWIIVRIRGGGGGRDSMLIKVARIFSGSVVSRRSRVLQRSRIRLVEGVMMPSRRLAEIDRHRRHRVQSFVAFRRRWKSTRSSCRRCCRHDGRRWERLFRRCFNGCCESRTPTPIDGFRLCRRYWRRRRRKLLLLVLQIERCYLSSRRCSWSCCRRWWRRCRHFCRCTTVWRRWKRYVAVVVGRHHGRRTRHPTEINLTASNKEDAKKMKIRLVSKLLLTGKLIVGAAWVCSY